MKKTSMTIFEVLIIAVTDKGKKVSGEPFASKMCKRYLV